MEPYVTDDHEVDRPTSEQPPAEQTHGPPAIPRRKASQPVRFASPVAGSGEASTSRGRPLRRTSRDQSPSDGGERAGPGGSPFLGDRSRQTSSPSSMEDPPARERRSGRGDARARKRTRSSSPDSPPVDTRDNRASRATSPGGRGSYARQSRLRGGASEPRYYRDERDDIRFQWDRVNPFSPAFGPQYGYLTRPPRPQPSAGYDNEEEVDVLGQTERPVFGRRTKPTFDPTPRPHRRASRYDSGEEPDIRVRRDHEPYVTEWDRLYRAAPYLVPAPANYYQDDYEQRASMLGDSYLPPRPYPRQMYPLTPHRNSTTYDEGDDRDFRMRRKPRPYLVDHRHATSRPTRINLPPSGYLVPPISGRDRSRTPVTPPRPSIVPIAIGKRYESDDEDLREPNRYRRRARSRSCTPPPSNAPVIINNRIYNDYEDDDHITRPGRLDEPDLGFVPEAYPFSLSRHNKSLQGTESILSLGSDISDISEKNEQPEEPPPKVESKSGITYHVLRSQYVGDGVIGGSHAVQLSLITDASPKSTKGVSSIFRWVHFEDKNMDFDNFEHNVLNIPGLTDTEISGIAKTLGRVKKSHDKPLQTSTKVKTRYMAPSFLQENLSGEKRPVASKVRTISWLCAPYFCLEKYATPSGLSPSSHPMRTLLQAKFALIQKERDMKQAVCYLQSTPTECCFHIAQVWFLILDNSLVVSCARLSITSLQGDFISVLPKIEVQPSLSSPNILVSTKSSLLWAIPLDECQTWFGFVSLFWDYWPLRVEVKYNEKKVTASEWPRIVVLAKKTTVRLVVEFRTFIKPEPVKGILLYEEGSTKYTDGHPSASDNGDPTTTCPTLRPTDPGRPKQFTKKSTDRFQDEFHVFTWLNSYNESQDAHSRSSSANVDYLLSGFESQGLEDDLTEIDAYLSKETSLSHHLTYNRCPHIHSRSKSTIYDAVADLKPDALSTEEHVIECYETVVGILNAAELLFRFFLPPDSDVPTTSKYWGALLRLFKYMPRERQGVTSYHRGHTQADLDASEVLDWLNMINKSTEPFKDYLSHVPLADRSNIHISEEITTAWLHLVLALAFSVEDMRPFDIQMTTCHDLIERGIEKVVSKISKVELSNYAILLPFEFASLIAFQLSRDKTGSAADISDTYLEHLRRLQADIEGNPLDRSHQDRIVSLKQEIEVISETLDLQQYVLKQSQRGFIVSRGSEREDSDSPYPRHSRHRLYRIGGHVLPTDAAGVQSIMIQDNLALVESRIKGFREMREIATELGDWNIQKIDSNKDRQEAAIYAFTIVTIIFLPLSTVAGIMGMNTSDVRDMSFGQWVYWLTAIPLTGLVIALCLAWAGELNNFQEGFMNLWRRNPREYKLFQEQYGGSGRRRRYYHGGVTFNRTRMSNRVYVNEENWNDV